MKNKLSFILSAPVLGSVFISSAAFAAIPSGTVLIGDTAYDLNYANNSDYQNEITQAVVNSAGKIFIKSFDGSWVDNNTNSSIDSSSIPSVTYKDSTGTARKYKSEDGDADDTNSANRANSADSKNSSGKPGDLKEGEHAGGMKIKLDALVTAGTITQVQETAIETAMETAMKSPDRRSTSADPEGVTPESGMKTQLDALVTAGTITSDQETAIVKAMTPSDNGKGGDSKSGDHNGSAHEGGIETQLDALVTTGTITSDQETAIKAAMETAMKSSDKSSSGNSQEGMKTQLDALVTAGTITSDQETSIEKLFTPSKQ